MAVTQQNSAEYATVNPPADKGGRVRVAYFNATQSGAGDADSGFNLVAMPGGDLRIVQMNLIHADFGAARTLDIGHGGYSQGDGITVAADPEYWLANLDVATAGSNFSHPGKKLDTAGGFTLTARIQGGTVDDGKTLSGYVLYITD